MPLYFEIPLSARYMAGLSLADTTVQERRVQHSISLSGQVCIQKMIKLSDFFSLFIFTFCSV